MSTDATEKDFVLPKAAADILDVSLPTLYLMIKRGQLTRYRKPCAAKFRPLIYLSRVEVMALLPKIPA